MPELTTNDKGAIAEAAIALEATKLGFEVLRPLQEGRRYDLVLDRYRTAFAASAVQMGPD